MTANVKANIELSAHYEGKRVIIFGGAGFIGSALAGKLVRLRADVTRSWMG